MAARAAALVSLMRNGVGNIGSVPPVISTARAHSSGQPAIGKSVRRASLVMVGTPGCVTIVHFRLLAPCSPFTTNRHHEGETRRQHITAMRASTRMLCGLAWAVCTAWMAHQARAAQSRAGNRDLWRLDRSE